jgi:hypothetical protein
MGKCYFVNNKIAQNNDTSENLNAGRGMDINKL